jgi:transcriptional antiterminator RfaH
MRRWYLIHTKPSGEALAQANLERQEYEVYLPRLSQSVQRQGGRREQVTPLFPRYLFLRLSEGVQALGPVRSSIGVAGVVRFGASYALVPDRIVRDLQARADPVSGLHHMNHASQPLVAGLRVRITCGTFDGLEGVFEREAGADRVVVLLNLLGRGVAVGVPAGSVQPAYVA